MEAVVLSALKENEIPFIRMYSVYNYARLDEKITWSEVDINECIRDESKKLRRERSL